MRFNILWTACLKNDTHCYLDDILIAIVGSAKEHCELFSDILRTLDDKVKAIKWEK